MVNWKIIYWEKAKGNKEGWNIVWFKWTKKIVKRITTFATRITPCRRHRGNNMQEELQMGIL